MKFTKRFTQTLEKHDVQTSLLPVASPNLKGRVERYVESIKLECLSRFIVFGRRHLDDLVSEFNAYYNRHRAHSSRGHLPPVRDGDLAEVVTLKLDEIEVKSYAGGLVKGFQRKAA